MKAIIKRFVRDESGATAIEYGVIAAGISVAIIAAVQATGANLNGTFTATTRLPKKPRFLRGFFFWLLAPAASQSSLRSAAPSRLRLGRQLTAK